MHHQEHTGKTIGVNIAAPITIGETKQCKICNSILHTPQQQAYGGMVKVN